MGMYKEKGQARKSQCVHDMDAQVTT
jgi:hypothetical protein